MYASRPLLFSTGLLSVSVGSEMMPSASVVVDLTQGSDDLGNMGEEDERLLREGAGWLPSDPEAYFGEHPVLIRKNTTILFVDGMERTTADLKGGDLFSDRNGDLYIWYGEEAILVTGLCIEDGATLTLPRTLNGLNVEFDIENRGTITAEVGARSLNLYCANYIGAQGSQIQLVGREMSLAIYATHTDLGYGDQVGSIFNRGDINLSGPSSDQGGIGGSVLLFANQRVENTGTIDLNGGEGLLGAGGAGGSLIVHPQQGAFYNAGAILLRGGDGVTMRGKTGRLSVQGHNRASWVNAGVIVLDEDAPFAEAEGVSDFRVTPVAIDFSQEEWGVEGLQV